MLAISGVLTGRLTFRDKNVLQMWHQRHQTTRPEPAAAGALLLVKTICLNNKVNSTRQTIFLPNVFLICVSGLGTVPLVSNVFGGQICDVNTLVWQLFNFIITTRSEDDVGQISLFNNSVTTDRSLWHSSN